MLSRVAEAIYWAGRYIERAENTARLIRVNSHLVMDTPKGISPGWQPLISITGLGPEFNDYHIEPTERNVVKYLIGDINNAGSIINSLMYARENCRTIREIIPRTAWQKLNKLYLFAKESIPSGLTQKGRDNYLDGIISGSQQLNGLLGSVMYQDEAWYFLRIGRNIERAEMTTRILDVRSSDLLTDAEELFESRSLESVQWISILKSLSAYSIYRRRVQVRVNRTPVLEFLFYDTQFPRSIAHCLASVEESVGHLANNPMPLKSLKAIEHRLHQKKIENLKQQELHQFIDELQLKIRRFHDALESQYFLSHQQEK
jgi:uncharacterized alpha-E superfamily protein